MRVVDISDLASPRKVGLMNTPGYAEGIVIVNDRAYIADGESGLRVADISVPKSPKETALNDTPGYAFDVHVSGNLAFVADGKAGLRILDDSGHSVSIGLRWISKGLSAPALGIQPPPWEEKHEQLQHVRDVIFAQTDEIHLALQLRAQREDPLFLARLSLDPPKPRVTGYGLCRRFWTMRPRLLWCQRRQSTH